MCTVSCSFPVTKYRGEQPAAEQNRLYRIVHILQVAFAKTPCKPRTQSFFPLAFSDLTVHTNKSDIATIGT